MSLASWLCVQTLSPEQLLSHQSRLLFSLKLIKAACCSQHFGGSPVKLQNSHFSASLRVSLLDFKAYLIFVSFLLSCLLISQLFIVGFHDVNS